MKTIMPRRALQSGISLARVCPNCLQQQPRLFSSSTAAPPPPPPPHAGIAPLSSRKLLSVSGPDAAKFLQGLVTANVVDENEVARTDGFYAGFLNATGRILNDLFIYPNAKQIAGIQDENAFLIEVDANHQDSLARVFKRYKLRSKITLRKVQPDEASVWQAWNEDAGSNIQLPSSSPGILVNDLRAPGMGYRILQAGPNKPEIDLDDATQDAYTIRRYLRGVPEGQDEIFRETGLPQESNMDYMNGIHFHKGCYVGQELTIRTKHRGVVRKRILPCMIYDEFKSPPSTLQYNPDGADSPSPHDVSTDMIPSETSIGRVAKRGRSAGKWLKGVGNIGLGLCRLEIMTDITLPGETTPSSYEPNHEFKLEWGEEESKTAVRVKAFVPDWLRAGLDAAAADAAASATQK